MPTRHFTKHISPQLVLVGSFGAGNLGDELILAGFLKKLRTDIPAAQITVFSGNIRESEKWHPTPRPSQARGTPLDAKGGSLSFLPLLPFGFRSFFRFDWLASLRAIRNCDAVIFPGGGLFTDDESLRAIFLWAMHLLVARFLWKPVYLFGQSVGPLRTALGKKIARFALARAVCVGVRDAASVEELQKLGIPKKRIQLGEDSAFFLGEQNSEHGTKSPRPSQARDTPLRKGGRITILLTARRYPRGERACFEKIKKELKKYPQAEISFVAFGAGDRAAWIALGRPGKFVKSPIGAAALLQFVREHDLVIGMRLHSLIAARIAGVPAVGVSYSRKVAAFCARAGFLFYEIEKEEKVG